MTTIERLSSGFEVLEAPRPDGRSVWFSDLAGGVYRHERGGATERVVPKRRRVGGIALHAGGGIIVTGRSVCHVRDDESRDVLALDGVVFNDCCTDAGGRLWVGGSSLVADATEERSVGAVYRLESGGSVTTTVEGLGIPNGMAFSPDGARFYVVDSSTRHVLAVDIGRGAGSTGTAEVFVDLSQDQPPDFGFPPRLPTPDGIAVDATGHVWVAVLGAGAVHRYTPEGRLERTIDVPDAVVTSVALGGVDGRDLYITTGKDASGSGGALYMTRAPAPGLPHTPTMV